MSLFLLIFIICLVIISKRLNYENFCNPYFWLSIFWILIIGVYFTAGINYKYGLSFATNAFLILCLFSIILGSYRSKNRKVEIFPNNKSHIPIKLWCPIGILGVLVFSYDYIRLNGIASAKESSSISFIGSLGSLCVPILLVLGLYLNAKSIRNRSKFSIPGIFLICAYSIPCMLNAGREAVLFCIIGFLCIFGYYKILVRKKVIKSNTKSLKGLLLISSLGLCLIFLGFLLLEITSSRYTSNEINVLLTKRDFSSAAIDEASSWNEFQFLYYNIASYFSHQIPFLDFTLKEYDGPYLLGMFEFNIISRRLPDALGLDYTYVFSKLGKLYNIKGESFAGGWNTVLGSLISDFTWVGAIIVCYWCGYFISLVKKKMSRTLDPRYVTLAALLCLSSFSTIQLGPFFQIQIYGTYIWWFIFFRKEETKRILI